VRIEPPEESLKRLWRDHSVELRRLAYFLVGDREEADQLVQDAFVLAWKRWDRVGGFETPSAWIRGAVVNKSRSWRRHLRIASRKRHLFANEPSTVGSVGAVLDTDLVRALGRLTPSQRAVVVLRYMEDLSIEQVAELTGRKPGTVRALTSQGLARLREELRKEDDAWASRTKT
jgi:RNA polymerase sigma-70 factor (sigma-E family)